VNTADILNAVGRFAGANSFPRKVVNGDASMGQQLAAACITCVPTSEGWLYLAIVRDLFTRKIECKGDA
jgi:hypothetical protein